MNTIGQKIKFYRERIKKSQMDLEVEIGASTGSISRMEKGKTNPDKETINKIAKALSLSTIEIDYLYGKTAVPASDKEISEAKQEVSEFLNKNGNLAYLLDERWRFLMISNTFLKLLNVKPKELEYVIGKTTVQVIVNKNSPVLQRIDNNMYEELLTVYLKNYYSNMSHMDADESYQNTVKDIENNPISKKIWDELVDKKSKKHTALEERVINFDLLGMKFPLYYSYVPLITDSRFILVEFHTRNKVLELLSKMI